jgi:hypothetical protein
MKLLHHLAILCALLLFAPANPAAEWVDLLASPLESAGPYAWKHFSENPQTTLSNVWQLRNGVHT